MGYEVKVVNRAGAVLATFNADAGDGDTRMKISVEEITWELNEPGMVRLRVPLFHPAALEIKPLTREVQVWRDGTLIFWGVPVQYEEDGQSVVWTCPGLLWYFTRRYFGPISIEYLTNPRFETNLNGWTAVGCTATRATNIRIRGPGTARLVSTAAGDNYIQQQFVVSSGATQGLGLTFAGWYWIDPAVPFVEPALDQRGIYIQATNSTCPDGCWEPVTMDAEKGKPQRVEVETAINANVVNETVTVRLYSPNGAIQWGALSVTTPESTSADFPGGSDATEMMRRIVDYAQHGPGKSELSILTSTPASGVIDHSTYQFSDLPNIFEALQTYPAKGLSDYEVRFTSTTRTFTTYAPRKGSLKAYTATVPGTSVLSMGYRVDGQQTASKTIRRAAGDGSDRELGVATNTTPLEGLILEDVNDAPPEITIDGLDAYATTDLARMANPVIVPDFEVPAAGFIGVVEVGDSITLAVNWGAIQDSSNRRVVRMTLDPEAETVKVGVNVQ